MLALRLTSSGESLQYRPCRRWGYGTSAFRCCRCVSALPFGIWLFLAVEGVPLAAEESANPKKDMPKGIIGAILTLMVTGALVLFLTAGGAGAEFAGAAAAPLVDALKKLAKVLLRRS